VQFSTSNGTATGGAACTSGVDYITVTNAPVTFAPGETLKTASVTICSDALSEATETVNMQLTGPFTRPVESPVPEVDNAVLNINDTASLFRNASTVCTSLGGAADLYPSQITVAGGPAAIGSMRVTLYDLWHSAPDNMDVLLVGPGGQEFVLVGDAGGAVGIDPASPITLTLRDTAGQVLPNSSALTTGQFEPTTWESPVSNFPAPAPAGPYNEPGSGIGGTGTQTFLGNFGGTNANGIWRLYIRDDAGNPFVVTGCMQSGWGIEFLASTAANAEVSGRVLNEAGQGIRGAIVTMTDQTGETRTAVTGSFGYYQFTEVRTGGTYVINVTSQRYTFAPQIIQVFDNITDLDFIGH
jgi:hypothetical protein